MKNLLKSRNLTAWPIILILLLGAAMVWWAFSRDIRKIDHQIEKLEINQ